MEVKTNPFYELRNRLYASAAAGCSLIAEDFRLKRAIEAFQPMSEANKVFGKLYAMCNALLVSENKPADIIDCIALADALAVTQGTFADSSETEPAKPMKMLTPSHMTVAALEEYKEKIRKTPYAEQDFGNDFYKYIADPRLMSSFLEISGKNGGGTADLLIMLGSVYGEDIVQVYFDLLDHADEKANGNQLRYIADTYRDKYNDDYIRYAEDEKVPQGIRIAAIEAMAYSAENDERLTVLYKTSKGKVKNAALLSLCRINSDTAEEQLAKIVKAPKNNQSDFIEASGGKAAEEYVIRENEYRLENGIKEKDAAHPFGFIINFMLANKKNIKDIIGKIAKVREKDAVCSVPRHGVSSSLNDPLIHDIYEHDDEEYRTLVKELYNEYPLTFFYARFVLQLMEDPVDSLKKLGADHRKNDGTVTAVVNYMFTTPDGWYRIRKNGRSTDGDYKNQKLFMSVPDDIIEFIADPLEVYNYKEITGLIPDGNERQHVMDDMKEKCMLLKKLYKICQPCDREKIRAAAEKFAWSMIRNYPCEEAMALLPLVTDKPMNGIVYNHVKFSINGIRRGYWMYSVEHYNIPDEVIVDDMQRLMAEFDSSDDPEKKKYVRDIRMVLERHGVKE